MLPSHEEEGSGSDRSGEPPLDRLTTTHMIANWRDQEVTWLAGARGRTALYVYLQARTLYRVVILLSPGYKVNCTATAVLCWGPTK